MDIDKLLEKTGLTYEDLDKDEKRTLHSWMDNLQKNKVTLQSVKQYIKDMKASVEKELTKTDIGSKQDIFLKARLRNYLLLEAFLMTPEKAKEALERAMSGMIPRRP